MSGHIYTQSEIFAVVRQLLKKYHAESDIFCIAEELHRTMGKAVDVYELREVNAGSAFYHTIMEEGVRIA